MSEATSNTEPSTDTSQAGRNTSWALAVLAAMLVSGCTLSASRIAGARSPALGPDGRPDPYLLRGAVAHALAAEHGATAFAMLAEIEAGQARAAVFWPWLAKADGEIDDDVLAIVFQPDDAGYWVPGRTYKVSGSAKADFFERLGLGESPPAIRPTGLLPIEMDGLSDYIPTHVARSRAAYRATDLDALMATTESLARLFSDRYALWRDDVIELVLTAGRREHFEFVPKEIARGSEEATMSFAWEVSSGERIAEQNGSFRFARENGTFRIVEAKGR